MPPSPEPPPDPRAQPSHEASGSRADRVEELVFQALEAEDPAATLDAIAAQYPDLAEEIRSTFAELDQWELLGVPNQDRERDGIPERLGPFRLKRRLGAGGMGVVYLAEDDDLRRTVALKLIRPEQLMFPGARERFQREVETIARLQHPGIVPIFTVGKEERIPYFTMEHVVGCSLADALQDLRARGGAADGRALLEVLEARSGARDSSGSSSGSRDAVRDQPWTEVCVALAQQVASALQHAHDRGILHRDVKPSNILLRPDGRALLVDFGLAWSDEDDQRLTRTQSQLGSLPYLAPEQVAGTLRDPSRQGDVYALGVTLYEMLALRNPYLGPNAEETRRRILEARSPSLRRGDRSISWELETVCLAAMDPDPAKRYRTAGDLQRDLERVRCREPIEARRPGWIRRVRRWGQRHPAMVAAGVVALLALAVGLLAFGVTERTARRAAERLQAESEAERYSALLSTASLELGDGLRAAEARRALWDCPPALRGWEWAHLEYASDESATRISDLGASVEALAWQPSGDGLWLALQDSSLRLHDAAGRETLRLDGQDVSALAFCGATGAFVTGTRKGVLQLRDAGTGEVTATFAPGPEGPPLGGQVAAIAFDPDGARVFSASGDGRVCAWDVATRTLLADLGRHRGPAQCLAVSRDGARIASGGFDRQVLLFDAALQQVGTRRAKGWVTGLEFSADGKLLFVADGEELSAFEADAPERPARVLDRAARGSLAVQLSPDGSVLAAVLDRRAVHLYCMDETDPRRGQRIARLRGHEGLVQRLAFHPDSRRLATGSSEPVARIWRTDEGAEHSRRPHPSMVVATLCLSHDDVVSADSRGNLRRTSLSSGATVELAAEHQGAILALQWMPMPSGLLVPPRWLSVDAAGLACLWYLDDVAPAASLQLGPLTALRVLGGDAVPPGEPAYAAGSADGQVRLLASDGTVLAQWAAHDDYVTALVARDGSRFWSASVDGTLREWSADGTLLRELDDHPAWISGLTLSPDWRTPYGQTPDGQTLVSTCADTAVRLFHADTGALRATLWGHGRVPMAAAWTPDGRRLVTSGGYDQELRFWDPVSGRGLVAMRRDRAVTSLAFAPDGSALVLGNRVGEVRWLVPRAGGPLPPAEFRAEARVDRMTSAPGGRQH